MRAPLLSVFVVLALLAAPTSPARAEDPPSVPNDGGGAPGGGAPLTPQELSQQRQQLVADPNYNLVSKVVGRVFDGLGGKPVTQANVDELKTYLGVEQNLRKYVMTLPDDNGARDKISAILDQADTGNAADARKQMFSDIMKVLQDNKMDLKQFKDGAAQMREAAKNDLSAMKDNPFAQSLKTHDMVAAMVELPASSGGGKGAGGGAGAVDGFMPSPVQAAQDAIESGDTAGAMANLNQAIEENPQDGEALSLRSAANYMNGDTSAAQSDAQAALGVNPHDSRAQQILGMTQGRSGSASMEAADNAAALGADKSGGGTGSASGSGAAGWLANIAVSSNKGTTAAALRGAQASLSMGNSRAAIENLTNAIALDPGNAQAYNLRAIAYNRSSQFALALKDAAAGLKVDPKNVSLLLAKAAALNKLHRYAEAEAAARQALELDPNSPLAYNALAEALAGQHRNPEAIAALKTAAGLDSRYAEKAKEAVQLPSESDLTFLFPDDGSAGAAPQQSPADSAAERARRFKFIATASIVGGSLLALGILQFFMPNIKQALSKYTREGPTVAELPAAEPTPAPRRIEVMTQRESKLLKDRFQLGGQIGAGGMGLVYEGFDVQLKRRVAVKKMRDELRAIGGERDRFIAEAKVVAGLHHPGIVEIYAVAEEGQDVYLVFEYVTGKTLHDIAHAGRPLSLGQALPILKAAADAIDYAHSRSIIHRDLKPSNIMVTDEGRTKVMDFGIARIAKDALARYTQTNTVVGTPPYMAPEQEQGVVRRESDVYALAVCLYEMLSGVLPFNSGGQGMLMNKLNRSYAPLSRAVPGLPPAIDEVFARVFDPDPEKRFHSAKEFVSGLEALALPQRG